MILRLMMVVLLLLRTSVQASLGDQESSVQSDHARIGGTFSKRAAAAQLFSVNEIKSPEGITIKEFSNLDGKIFAVSWKGPFMPDLNQLLGQYFKPYLQMLESKSTRFQGAAHFESEDLVVHSGGKIRDFSGLAYLPKIVPQGVKIQDLK